jgi:hypothetical protein
MISKGFRRYPAEDSWIFMTGYWPSDIAGFLSYGLYRTSLEHSLAGNFFGLGIGLTIDIGVGMDRMAFKKSRGIGPAETTTDTLVVDKKFTGFIFFPLSVGVTHGLLP